MSSIIKENQYFDNGCDFCKVYTCDMLDRVERALLEARISFSIREEETSLFERIFGNRKNKYRSIVRINSLDYERAVRAVSDIRGVSIICEEPGRDWCPMDKVRRRQQEAKERHEEEYYYDVEAVPLS